LEKANIYFNILSKNRHKHLQYALPKVNLLPWSVENNYLKLVQFLLKDPKNIYLSIHDQDAIITACQNGYTDIAEMIMRYP
jgi:hypothetical protein